jgi:hypothetical protein
VALRGCLVVLAAYATLAITARARTGIRWRYVDFDRDGWVELY